jgi:hypothetical protein
MRDNRSVREQVLSGLRIGGLIVLSFVFFAAMAVSAALITGREAAPNIAHRTFGTLALGMLAAILFFTVHHWTKWLIGILAYCLLRLFVGLIFGPYLKHPVSRLQVASWIVYLAIAALLTMPHIRRRPKGAGRFGLVGFVLCVPFAMILESSKPLVLGLSLLALGELIEALRLWKQHRQRSKQLTFRAGVIP